MRSLEEIRKMFLHDGWANRQLLGAVAANSPAPGKALEVLAHLLATERLWLNRLERETPSLAVWPDLDVEQCRALAEELEGLWIGYLDGLDEHALSRRIEYRDSVGHSFASRVDDMLLQVVLHSSYHRGQIVRELRLADHEPPYVDYIHATRERLLGGP